MSNDATTDPVRVWTRRLPSRSPETEPFWDACNRDEFIIQRCDDCGKTQYHYRALCAHCWSSNVSDVVTSGRGTVWTCSVVKVSRSVAGGGSDPYVVAVVELEEGVKVYANIVDCEPDAVKIGDPVALTWAVAEDGQHIPLYTPAEVVA